jgi:hypothetical protein
MIHELKTWENYFQLTADGIKTFELRKNDRNFQAGHELLLNEYDKETERYTGRKLHFKISYILEGRTAVHFGLKNGYCIIGLKKI